MLASLLVLTVSQKTPIDAANAFLDALSSDSRKAALMFFEDDYRTNFRFVPAERQGAFVRDFTPEARSKADAWLGLHLSPGGMQQVEAIRHLEDVLRAQENNNPIRDKTLYAYTFFGKPANDSTWGWRYEGHHLSLNYTYKNGELVSSTPQFLGSNPAEIRSGIKKGTRVLAEESDIAFELLNSFSDEQKKIAIVGDKALRTVNGNGLGFLTNNDRIAKIGTKDGLAYSAMNKAQQGLLKKLVEAHSNVQRDSEVRHRMKKIEKAGWNEVVFAWMGSTKLSADHYYRIQGPTVLIEYDNAQDNTNHIHSVWRDFKGDFGRDVLGDHYAASPHH